MSRKKQPAVTRQSILDAAGECFSKQGFAATGIGAIVENSGLTKGALFHHFPDKQELALAWIREPLRQGLIGQWVTPLEAVHSLQDLSSLCRNSCQNLRDGDSCTALVAMAAELGGREPALSGALEELFELWRGALAGLLRRGQQDGWIHRSIQADTEAGILVSMVAGLSVLRRCHDHPGDWVAPLVTYLDTLRPV